MKLSLSPETERLIEEKISSGRYQSADEVVREGLKRLEERDNGGPTPDKLGKISAPKTLGGLAKFVEEITKDIPDSAWEKVPSDLAQNIDYYLYGTKKKS